MDYIRIPGGTHINDSFSFWNTSVSVTLSLNDWHATFNIQNRCLNNPPKRFKTVPHMQHNLRDQNFIFTEVTIKLHLTLYKCTKEPWKLPRRYCMQPNTTYRMAYLVKGMFMNIHIYVNGILFWKTICHSFLSQSKSKKSFYWFVVWVQCHESKNKFTFCGSEYEYDSISFLWAGLQGWLHLFMRTSTKFCISSNVLFSKYVTRNTNSF